MIERRHELLWELIDTMFTKVEYWNEDQIIVHAPWSHPLTNDLKINSLCYHRYDY